MKNDAQVRVKVKKSDTVPFVLELKTTRPGGGGIESAGLVSSESVLNKYVVEISTYSGPLLDQQITIGSVSD